MERFAWKPDCTYIPIRERDRTSLTNNKAGTGQSLWITRELVTQGRLREEGLIAIKWMDYRDISMGKRDDTIRASRLVEPITGSAMVR